MNRTFFLLGTLAVCLAASPTLAQTVYVHGGAGFPRSTTFNTSHNTGLNAGLGIGVPVSSQVEVLLRGDYDRFTASLADEAVFSSYGVFTHVKWNGRSSAARVRPYALIGGGTVVGVKGPFDFALGLSGGAGISLRTSARTRASVEPNYMHVFTEGSDRTYVPVRLGMAYSLRSD